MCGSRHTYLNSSSSLCIADNGRRLFDAYLHADHKLVISALSLSQPCSMPVPDVHSSCCCFGTTAKLFLRHLVSFSPQTSMMLLYLSKHHLSSSTRFIFVPGQLLPHRNTEPKLRKSSRASFLPLSFLVPATQIVVPVRLIFSGFPHDSCRLASWKLFVTSLHIVCFWSAVVPLFLGTSPVCRFPPPNQDEILLAMTLFFRNLICCLLFLLGNDGDVDGDLRPIELFDLKWPCRFVLRHVYQQASSSMSCPSSSLSSSRSGLPPSSHRCISLSALHTHPGMQCTIVNSNGQVKKVLMAILIVEQIIVEAGRSRDHNISHCTTHGTSMS